MVSHTYVEPENRGKLRALAAGGPVTAVIPDRWSQSSLGRSWRQDETQNDHGVTLVPAKWRGPARPTLGIMRVPPRSVAADAVVQIEEEPWTPTAYFAARRKLGAATVLFTWENVERSFPPPWSSMRQAVFGRIAGLIAGNIGAADVARGQGYRGLIAVIPQLGIELPANPARTEAPELRITFVGRLAREKGVDVLLRALGLVESPWRCTILGDGPERSALERVARDFGHDVRTRFLGPRPHAEVAAVWPETDLLVLPSRSSKHWREQLGHVLLEAMSHGVATVGSTCGAIPEVIGDAGLVFPEGDVEALASALQQLALDRTLVRRLGDAGRRRVAAEFTNDCIAARTRAFHDEVLGAR